MSGSSSESVVATPRRRCSMSCCHLLPIREQTFRSLTQVLAFGPVIRGALGSLVGMVTWIGSYYVARKLGFVQEKPALFHVITLMVLFVTLASCNFAATTSRADGKGLA